MKTVAIDVRALTSSALTGVGVYELQLLKALLAHDPEFNIKLWTSGAGVDSFHYVKSLIQRPADQHVHYQMSNRLFNLATTVGWSGNQLYRQASADCYFFPQLNFIPVPLPKPFAVTVHDLSFRHQPNWYDLKGRLWHRALQLDAVLTRAQAIIAVSESTAEHIQHFYPHISSSKIHIIHNGLSIETITQSELMSIRQKLDLPESFALFVGTLEPRKNLASVISALIEVQKERPEFKLVVAGKFGWSRRQKELNQHYRDSVIWLDYVSEQEKSALYQLAKVFIWPSFHEGFGFPPLEAAFYGTPVITSYATAMPELLQNAAWYVNPYNYRELAEVIFQVLAIDEERRQRPDLVDRYSWRETARKTIDLLQQL